MKAELYKIPHFSGSSASTRRSLRTTRRRVGVDHQSMASFRDLNRSFPEVEPRMVGFDKA